MFITIYNRNKLLNKISNHDLVAFNSDLYYLFQQSNLVLQQVDEVSVVGFYRSLKDVQELIKVTLSSQEYWREILEEDLGVVSMVLLEYLLYILEEFVSEIG